MVRAMNHSADASSSARRRGILWMLLTMLAFATMDTFAKYLTQSFSLPQVVWARYLFTGVLVVAMVGRRFPAVLSTRQPALQVARAVMALLTTGLFFAGLMLIPLADATALVVTAPILVAALSMPLLGERVGMRQWAGVAAGFVGAMIIVRPGVGVFQWAALLPLGAAVLFSLHQITARILSRTDAALTTLTYTAGIGVLIASVVVPFFWITPEPLEWLYMAAVGVFGCIGQFALIKAYEAAPAAVVAPLAYSSLIWASLYGLVVFGDSPDTWTISGALVIVASGLYVQRGRRAQKPGIDE
jgi:drug/metabolite transporter (DMT)-like permease